MLTQTYFYLFILNLPIFAEARRGGIGIDIGLDLSSVNSATFSFCVAFAGLIAFNALGAIKILPSKNAENRYPRRLIFLTFILLASLSLVAFFAIEAVIVAMVYKEDGPEEDLSNVVFVMTGFTFKLANIFITGGLLLLLDGCPNYNLLGSLSESSRKVTQNIKRGIDIALLLLMLISNVVLTSFIATAETIERQQYINVVTGFQRTYIAAFFLISLDILITAILLWKRSKTSDIDEMFRLKLILKLIMILIAPFLLVVASFYIGEYIATSVIVEYDYFVFLLVDTIVTGLFYFAIIVSCLCLGRIPKTEPKTESREDSDRR